MLTFWRADDRIPRSPLTDHRCVAWHGRRTDRVVEGIRLQAAHPCNANGCGAGLWADVLWPRVLQHACCCL